jgi:hypothetical protein
MSRRRKEKGLMGIGLRKLLGRIIHIEDNKLRGLQSAKRTIPTERPPLVGEI